MVSEDERTFYAEFNNYDQTQIDDWLRTNVISNLKFAEPNKDEEEYYLASRSPGNLIGDDLYNDFSVEMKDNTKIISFELKRLLSQFNSIEIWSDCLSYDWVLFNDLFEGTLNIPKNIYYIPFDICTVFKMKNIVPDINREEFCEVSSENKHNALQDAKIIKKCYEKLLNNGGS